jgi:hypothetical protein
MKKANTLVCVATFSSRAVAEVAKCALEAEGIKSTISAEDTGYDITLAHGGARLMVNFNSVAAARRILTAFDTDTRDARSARPIRFSLKALFGLTTLVALSVAGYVINGPHGALCLPLGATLATIGIQVLLSLEGRRPLQKTFVAIAGSGFVLWGLGYFLWGLVK